MNVVQAGPAPIVAAAAAAAQVRPAENRQAELPAKAVKAAAKGEQAAKYAAHNHGGPKSRGSKVDIEA